MKNNKPKDLDGLDLPEDDDDIIPEHITPKFYEPVEADEELEDRSEVLEVCPDCNGTGKDPMDASVDCATCDGDREIPSDTDTSFDFNFNDPDQ